MSKKIENKKCYDIHETSCVSPIFDRAVPKSQIITQSDNNLSLKVRVGNDTPSPFVVKLEKPKKKVLKEDIFNPVSEVQIQQNDLVINFEDLVAQAEVEEESLERAKESVELLSFEDLLSDNGQEIDDVELELADFNEMTEMTLEVGAIVEEEARVAHSKSNETIEETLVDESNAPAKTTGRWHILRLKAVASFTALSLLLVGPLQAMDSLSQAPEKASSIEQVGRDAFTNVESAVSSLSNKDFSTASMSLNQAESQFSEMEEQFNNARRGFSNIALLIPKTARTIRTADALIETGSELTRALNIFNQALNEIDSDATLSISDKVRVLGIYAERMREHTTIAVDSISKIDLDIIPENERAGLEKLMAVVPALDSALSQYTEYSSNLFTLLGGEHRRDYLLLFNNTAEIRATGGFIGSYGEITLNRGSVERINIPEGGSYSRQGQSTAFYLAPEPLQLINERWELQDSNWYPDFPLSAKQALKLHGATGGPTMDGVISINSTILPAILGVTGPIMLSNGQELNSENVLFFVRSSIDEANSNEETSEAPKAILSEIGDLLADKLGQINAEESVRLFDVLISSLETREIQIYLRDNEAQSIIKKNGWSGEQKQISGDYLQIINTNIGGGKTDNVIDQQVKLHVDIQNDGSIINTITYEKTHLGLETSFLEGKNNVDFVRFYVPQGSELINAEGFDEIPDDSLFEDSGLQLEPDPDHLFLTSDTTKHEPSGTLSWDENGKTVFGNWIQTKPGETEIVRITYKTPINLGFSSNTENLTDRLKGQFGMQNLASYSLYLQKQSGITRRNTEVTVSHPGNRSIIWQSSENTDDINNLRDTYLQLLFK